MEKFHWQMVCPINPVKLLVYITAKKLLLLLDRETDMAGIVENSQRAGTTPRR